jgi:hypothetical protein
LDAITTNASPSFVNDSGVWRRRPEFRPVVCNKRNWGPGSAEATRPRGDWSKIRWSWVAVFWNCTAARAGDGTLTMAPFSPVIPQFRTMPLWRGAS